MHASSVSRLRKGATAKIQDLGDDPILAQRLMALGILPGQQIFVEQRFPLSGPLLCKYCHGKFGIRHKEAAKISISPNHIPKD